MKNSISEYFKNHGWTKEGEKWTMTFDGPTRVVIVNGQQTDKEPLKVKVTAEDIGEGYIANFDDSDRKDFREIRVTVENDGAIQFDDTVCVDSPTSMHEYLVKLSKNRL